MKVVLRNPRRELDLTGPVRVQALLDQLGVNREAVLVIVGDTLVTGDAVLAELRTISGKCPCLRDRPRSKAKLPTFCICSLQVTLRASSSSSIADHSSVYH